MDLVRCCFCFLIAVAVTAPLHAQPAQPADQAIRAAIEASAADWNRGDLDRFATAYKNSPDILFIGRKVSRGYAQMLATYRAAYSTPAKMGTLRFSDIEVQPLDQHYATATGKFHLQRTAAGGGNVDGFYLLVLENTAQGWKIIRDDSTVVPPAK